MSMNAEQAGHFADEGARRLEIRPPGGATVMEYQIDMIGSNSIGGLLPVKYLRENGKPRFYYDTGGSVPLSAYFAARKPDVRTAAEILMAVSATIGQLGKFLLEEDCLVLEMERVFIDPAKMAPKLAYLPIEQPDSKGGKFIGFVVEMVKAVQPEDSTGKLFCRRILEEAKKPDFNYEGFNNFLLDILCFSKGSGDARGDGGNGGGTGEPLAPGGFFAPNAVIAPDALFAPGGEAAPGGFSGRGAGEAAGSAAARAAKAARAAAGRPKAKSDALYMLIAVLIAVFYFACASFAKRGIFGGPAGQNAVFLVAVAGEAFAAKQYAAKKLAALREQAPDAGMGAGAGAGKPKAKKRGRGAASGAVAHASAWFGADAPGNAGLGLAGQGGGGHGLAGLGGTGQGLTGQGGAGLEKSRHVKLKFDKSPAEGKKESQFGLSVAAAARLIDKQAKTGRRDKEREVAERDLWEASLSAASEPVGDNAGKEAGKQADGAAGGAASAETDASAGASGAAGAGDAAGAGTGYATGASVAAGAADAGASTGTWADVGAGAGMGHAAGANVAAGAGASAGTWAGTPDMGIGCALDGRGGTSAGTLATADALANEGASAWAGTGFPVAAAACGAPANVGVACAPAVAATGAAHDGETEFLPIPRQIGATLLIKDDRREYGVFLKNNAFTIGRVKETSDLAIDNNAVGKTHARLERNGGVWHIVDLNSKNGTYLNNIRLESGGRRKLGNFDLITVANADMIFILKPEA